MTLLTDWKVEPWKLRCCLQTTDLQVGKLRMRRIRNENKVRTEIYSYYYIVMSWHFSNGKLFLAPKWHQV